MKKRLFVLAITICILIASHGYHSGVIHAKDNDSAFETHLINQLSQRKRHFDLVFYGDSADLKPSIKNALETHKYLKFTTLDLNWKYLNHGSHIEIEMHANYLLTAQEEFSANEMIKSIIEEIVDPSMTDHEKVKAVHDWILLNASYDETLNYRSHFELLTHGAAVCHGYALLFDRMLDPLNIPSVLVTGNVPEYHIWNMVQLNGLWFHVDVTFNDPLPDESGRLLYDFYMLSDDELKKTHTIENQHNLPKGNTSYALLLNKLLYRSDYDIYAELLSQLNLERMLQEDLDRHVLTQFAQNPVNISGFGDYVYYDKNYGYPYINLDNRTLVPFRATLTHFGAAVDWDPTTKTALAYLKDIQIEVPIGESHIYVNGDRLENDTSAVIKDGRTYLPIRIVLESLGFLVDWDPSSQTVLVSR
jgi:hypothetical protein